MIEGATGHVDAWWRRAVIYQLYVRSFADGNGDGIGDLVGAGTPCRSTCSSPRSMITTVLPVTLFLVFQRFFLRGAGLGGAVKG